MSRRRLSPRAQERRDLVLGLAVLAVIGVLIWLSTALIDGDPFSHPYRVRAQMPGSAPVLKDGDEVRIAGQRAGEIRSVRPGRGGPMVAFDLDDESRIGRDARVQARVRGLAGAVYLELEPGDTHNPLPDGGLIPRAQTGTGVQVTDVAAAFDPRTRAALGRTLSAYGAGVAGRGQALHETLVDLGPALGSATPLLRALSPRPGALSGLTRATGDVLRAAAPGDDLGALLPAGRRTFGALAASAPAIAGALRAAPAFETEAAATLPRADALLAVATVTVRRLNPGVRALRAALPGARALLAREADLGRLAALARAAQPVLQSAGPALRDLYPSATAVVPLADALGPLAAYVSRYPQEIYDAPDGFVRWGGFKYAEGQASGHAAVRFSMVFTCQHARDPYPAPGDAEHEEKRCGF